MDPAGAAWWPPFNAGKLCFTLTLCRQGLAPPQGFSRLLRQSTDSAPQDGDLDANWVESMNSVMDDSRLLTLPSNERIRLLPHMKVLRREPFC